MRFGGEVHDRIEGVLIENVIDHRGVGDIALNKLVSRVTGDFFDVAEIAGIGGVAPISWGNRPFGQYRLDRASKMLRDAAGGVAALPAADAGGDAGFPVATLDSGRPSSTAQRCRRRCAHSPRGRPLARR